MASEQTTRSADSARDHDSHAAVQHRQDASSDVSIGGQGTVAQETLAPMREAERQVLSRNVPALRKSLYQPRPLTFTDKAFLPWMTVMLTNTKWSQQIANAESTWRSIEEQATQNAWFEGERRKNAFLCVSANGHAERRY
jgi:hypothetical protein